VPATRSLKTDWKRIGRSGATTDGRTIEPQLLLDCAETYDKETFTALIWPEHFHWINYGLVEELKAEKNKDGGVDLFAILSPNKMYLDTNSMGQRLFLSMELMANFAKTGKTYLTGLAATDDPASLATSEMRFSADRKSAGVISGAHEEISFTETEAPQGDQAKFANAFAQLFTDTFSGLFSGDNKSRYSINNQPLEEEFDMSDKAALEALQADMKTIKEQIAKFTAKHADDKKPDETQPDDAITKLSKQYEDLAARFEKFTAAPAEAEATKATTEILTKLTEQVGDLETKLAAALKEAPSSGGNGDHAGGEGEAAKFADVY
jgi:archaellum component FlaC